MGTRKTRDLPARLEGVRRRFERWRRTRKAALADSRSAVGFGGEDGRQRTGSHRTARALRVNYYALKKRVEQQAAAAADAAERRARPRLSSWLLPRPSVACECTLELEDAGGAKMRVHLKSIAMPDLAALSRSFWNRQP